MGWRSCSGAVGCLLELKLQAISSVVALKSSPCLHLGNDDFMPKSWSLNCWNTCYSLLLPSSRKWRSHRDFVYCQHLGNGMVSLWTTASQHLGNDWCTINQRSGKPLNSCSCHHLGNGIYRTKIADSHYLGNVWCGDKRIHQTTKFELVPTSRKWLIRKQNDPPNHEFQTLAII